MDSKLRDALSEVTMNKYPSKDFADSVDALSDFLELTENVSKLKAKDLLCLITGSLEDQKRVISIWGSIETIMRALLRITDPNKAASTSRISLEEMYKKVFNVVPEKRNDTERDFSLSGAKREQCEKNYPNYRFIGEFIELYQFRNDSVAHGVDDNKLVTLNQIITDICVVLLYLCQLNAKELNTQALVHRFLSELPTNWTGLYRAENQVIPNKRYVDFRWGANFECTTTEIALLKSDKLKGERYIKLIGQAGSGKTTALLHINQLLLNKYEEHELVPVFYELKNLRDMKDAFLPFIIESTFKVTSKAAESLMESQQLVFLLDGYNEILDREIRRQFAMELTHYCDKHDRVRVIITDRSAQNEILLLRKSKILSFKGITDKEREEYFRKNCDDANILEIILKTMRSDPTYREFELLTTPLKLFHFMQMTIESGTVPKDYIAEYIERLIEREREEKMDPNLDVLSDYLAAVTILFENNLEEEIEKHKMLAIMAKVDVLFGYKNYNTKQALDLARDMGILHEEIKQPDESRQKKSFYRFEEADYLIYFRELLYENETLFNGIVEGVE